jgi:hypothetical protein
MIELLVTLTAADETRIWAGFYVSTSRMLAVFSPVWGLDTGGVQRDDLSLPPLPSWEDPLLVGSGADLSKPANTNQKANEGRSLAQAPDFVHC